MDSPYLIQHINLLLRNVTRFTPFIELSVILNLSVAPLSKWVFLSIDRPRRHLSIILLKVHFQLFIHFHPVIVSGIPVKAESIQGYFFVRFYAFGVAMRPARFQSRVCRKEFRHKFRKKFHIICKDRCWTYLF